VSGENYISSDIPAILSFTKDFYLLNDLEFAVLSRDNVEFYNINLVRFEKQPKNIAWDMSSAEKGDFDDFMLKEIFEQPKSIRETIGARLNLEGKCILDEIKITKEELEKVDRIYVVACGTAMNAGMTIKKILEGFCKIQTEVDIASEFRYRNPLITKNTLCIYISQ